MKVLKFISLILLSIGVPNAQLSAQDQKIERKQIGVEYLTAPYAHIHQNPNRFSAALTTISCAHPLRIYSLSYGKDSKPLEVFNKEWRFVKAGPYEGYVRTSFLAATKPECFQDKYSKFFESLELEVADMYYWGRLYDLYDYGHTKVVTP